MGVVNPEGCKYEPSAERRRAIEDAQLLGALSTLDRSGVENLIEEMKAAKEPLDPEEITELWRVWGYAHAKEEAN